MHAAKAAYRQRGALWRWTGRFGIFRFFYCDFVLGVRFLKHTVLLGTHSAHPVLGFHAHATVQFVPYVKLLIMWS